MPFMQTSYQSADGYLAKIGQLKLLVASWKPNHVHRTSWLYWRKRSGKHQHQHVWVVTSSYVTTCTLHSAATTPLSEPNRAPVQLLLSVHSAVLLHPPIIISLLGDICPENNRSKTNNYLTG